MSAAQFLFEQDPFQFQFWAVGLVGAQPYGATMGNKKGKRGGDTGIDGVLYFRTPGGERLEKAIVSVKGGRNLNPGMVRDLSGVVEREKAAMGLFISLYDVTSGMREEAARSGAYRYGGAVYPRLQVFSVGDLLANKRPEMPHGSLNVSLENKAVRTAGQKDQGTLFGE